MKNLNRKGFTLVELLVVIAVLVVIMSIAVPGITSSLERSKQKQKDAKIELIISAAELYADRHKNSISGSSFVMVRDLISDKLLTADEIKDPFNSNRTICGHVNFNDFSFVENASEC